MLSLDSMGMRSIHFVLIHFVHISAFKLIFWNFHSLHDAWPVGVVLLFCVSGSPGSTIMFGPFTC